MGAQGFGDSRDPHALKPLGDRRRMEAAGIETASGLESLEGMGSGAVPVESAGLFRTVRGAVEAAEPAGVSPKAVEPAVGASPVPETSRRPAGIITAVAGTRGSAPRITPAVSTAPQGSACTARGGMAGVPISAGVPGGISATSAPVASPSAATLVAAAVASTAKTASTAEASTTSETTTTAATESQGRGRREQ